MPRAARSAAKSTAAVRLGGAVGSHDDAVLGPDWRVAATSSLTTITGHAARAATANATEPSSAPATRP